MLIPFGVPVSYSSLLRSTNVPYSILKGQIRINLIIVEINLYTPLTEQKSVELL